MEQLGQREEGTLRTSHRESQAVRRKPAPRAIQDAARTLVSELCDAVGGPAIRTRLDIERMKQPLSKGVFYAVENDTPADPGFLVFLPKQAPVFLQLRKHAPPPCTLRMRVSPFLAESGGSVLIATLDTIGHRLRIEDVWQWRGETVMQTTPYSGRRALLREFVERYWIPDARLMSGIVTTIVNPRPVADVFKTVPTGCCSVDLFPEAAGRKRLWLDVETRSAAPKPVPVPVPAQQPNPKPAVVRTVRAVPVDKMPDIYDLYDIEGLPISRAAVQQFAVSQELRANLGADGLWVQAKYNPTFGGYEILKRAQTPELHN